MTTINALQAAFIHGAPVLVHWRATAGDVLQQPAIVVSLPSDGRVVVTDLAASERHGRTINRVRLLAQIVRVEPLPDPAGG